MRPQIIVVHKSATPATGYTVVYIGRPSVLGNPFPMRDESDRHEVVRKYRSYLREEYTRGESVRKELEELADRVYHGECIALQCFCTPRECHGDVVKDAIEGIIRRRKT